MQSAHQHISFIKQIALGLNQHLTDFLITDVFKISKTEIVLIFSNNNEAVSLKLFIDAKQFFFNFYDYPIQRGQSVYPLFKDILNTPFIVEPNENDRLFTLNFNNGFSLLFKLYGPLANIILFKKQEVISAFRPDIKSDLTINFKELVGSSQPLETTICKQFYIYKDNQNQIILLLEPSNFELLASSDNVFEICNLFAKFYLSQYAFLLQKQQLQASVQRKLKKANADFLATKNAINGILTNVPAEEIGHILMANLHLINKGDLKVNLLNFYNNSSIEIKLKKDLSPQQNAAYYYKKSKNTKTQLADLEKKLTLLEPLILKLQKELTIIENATYLKELKVFGNKLKTAKTETDSKFKTFEFNGFVVLVGKSSANNDELTKQANKNDMWLHAKDVSGSHVIIKQKGRSEFSTDVITYAAQIAAYYSKAKSSGLVPVTYTLKKYVRKPKGALPGQVLIDKEEVILVEPKL